MKQTKENQSQRQPDKNLMSFAFVCPEGEFLWMWTINHLLCMIRMPVLRTYLLIILWLTINKSSRQQSYCMRPDGCMRETGREILRPLWYTKTGQHILSVRVHILWVWTQVFYEKDWPRCFINMICHEGSFVWLIINNPWVGLSLMRIIVLEVYWVQPQRNLQVWLSFRSIS
jgi:hypothetical protein